MGFWGKSKEQKEFEEGRKRYKAELIEEIDEKYELLLKALDKVRKLNPQWKVDEQGSTWKESKGKFFTFKMYDSLPNGIKLAIEITKNYKPYNSTTIRDSVMLRVSQDVNDNSATVYYGEFDTDDYKNSYPAYKESYQVLYSYIEDIIRPLLEERALKEKQAREDKEKAEQKIKDDFWNS